MADTSKAIDIAQNVAAAIGYEVPSSLIGTGTTSAKLMLALLNMGCRVLARKRGPFGQSWPELTREATVVTVVDQEWYALPQDFSDLINNTSWDHSRNWRTKGPVSPQEWQELKGGLIDTLGLTKRWRLSMNPDTGTVQMRIDPVPGAAGENLRFEYVSNLWARASSASPITLSRVTSNSHIPVFPSDLVELDLTWRVRKSQGQNYQTDIAEFELERDKAFALAVGLQDLDLAESALDLLDTTNVPESIPL